jgi:hypothetical protein
LKADPKALRLKYESEGTCVAAATLEMLIELLTHEKGKGYIYKILNTI